MTTDYTYEIHERGDRSSRVTLTADCRSTGVLWRAMSPLLRIAIRASDREPQPHPQAVRNSVDVDTLIR